MGLNLFIINYFLFPKFVVYLKLWWSIWQFNQVWLSIKCLSKKIWALFYIVYIGRVWVPCNVSLLIWAQNHIFYFIFNQKWKKIHILETFKQILKAKSNGIMHKSHARMQKSNPKHLKRNFDLFNETWSSIV